MQGLASIVTQSVSCRQLHIRTGRRSLVADFTWTFPAGPIHWLVGTNGSGKSSFLRVIARLRRPFRGNVEWSGPGAGRIRYLTPAWSAPADLRVADFVDFVYRLNNPTSDELTLALYPQSAERDRRFGTLSTGEAKRILLWAVLHSGSGPLVLDEPYEHLSRDAKQTLTECLRRRSIDDVVIIATNQDVPEARGDTVLTLNGDRIEVTRVS